MTVKITNNLTTRLQRVQRRLQALPEQAFEVFVENTPVLTGNARRRTRVQGDTIRAQYQYAAVLDKGASRQSPQGMIKPTLAWLRRAYPKQFRK
jgi:hypothetical protein